MYLHVFEEFVELINNHNAKELGSFMRPDPTFIDAQGSIMTDMDTIIAAWQMYFSMFPDYWIEIQEITEMDNTVFGFGNVSGTFTGHIPGDINNYFKLPIAIRAIIEGEKIKLWQVYADTKIPFDIIGKNE